MPFMEVCRKELNLWSALAVYRGGAFKRHLSCSFAAALLPPHISHPKICIQRTRSQRSVVNISKNFRHKISDTSKTLSVQWAYCVSSKSVPAGMDAPDMLGHNVAVGSAVSSQNTWIACTCHQATLIQADDHPNVLLLLNVVQVPKSNKPLLSANATDPSLEMVLLCCWIDILYIS